MNDKVYFLHADRHRSFLQLDTIILGEWNQACPKYPISMKYLHKSMGDEVDFLLADKHKNDSITLGVRSQTCPKC